jgi:hypothetical protein
VQRGAHDFSMSLGEKENRLIGNRQWNVVHGHAGFKMFRIWIGAHTINRIGDFISQHVMDHMPCSGHDSQVAMWQIPMQPDRLRFGGDDFVAFAGEDGHWHF